MLKFLQVILIILLFTFSNELFSQTGSIRGMVIDSESNLPMPGARIIVKGIKSGAVSNSKGEFTIFSVPEGAHELTLKYIGYKEVSMTVNVIANKTSDIKFLLEPAPVLKGEILVIGDGLKGQAKALNTQRNNINITNIVSSDQIGRFPDANVGDALKRISGITIQNDQGEARFGLIRGTAARLNSVMINGDRIPSAEAENREVQLDLIPADMVSQIEVNKVLTPDMDADAIGGAVNLVTRAPSSRRVSLTLGSTYNFLRAEPSFNGSLIAGDRFLNDKIGVVFSATLFDHILGSENIEAEWDDEENPFVKSMELRNYLIQRTRRSFSLGTDFKLNANNKVFFNAIYNWRDDWENRYALTYDDISRGDDGNYYFEKIEREVKGGIGNDRTDNARLEDQRTFNLSFGGEHLFSNLKMNWQANYAKASEERLNERYIAYTYEVEEDEVTEEPIPELINLDLSDTKKPFLSLPTDLALDEYGLDVLTEENGYTEDIDFNARVDFELPILKGNNKSFLKFGGRLRTKEKLRDNDYYEFSTVDGYEAIDDLSLIANDDFTDAEFLPGEKYKLGVFPKNTSLGSIDLDDENKFEKELKLDEYIGGNFNATEKIFGGYVMYTQNIGDKLTILGGVRLESTSLEYTAYDFNDTIEYNSESDVPQITGEQDYVNFLPNLQFKYNVTEKLIGRLAYTQTLARPNYFDLAPYQIIIPEDNALEIGNPALKPTISNNVDLLFDYYFDAVGLVSAGVFYKSLTDFIYTYELEDYTYNGNTYDDFIQPQNGSEASLFGFEVAFQRQLDFLPSFLRNLNAYINYTHTSSTTEGLPGRTDTDLKLPGTAENMFNFSLGYEDKYLNLRFAMNYASDYIDELGGNTFEDRYYDEQLFVDVNGSVNILKNLRFFFEANNLLNTPLRFYQGIQSRTMQAEYYNTRMNFGFKYDL